MEPQHPIPAASVTYGRACTNCARSKCKCVRRPGHSICERCRHLDKPCHPTDSVRKSRTGRNNADSRIAHLEGKIDGLVSVLQSLAPSATGSNLASGLLNLGSGARNDGAINQEVLSTTYRTVDVDHSGVTTSAAHSADGAPTPTSSSAISGPTILSSQPSTVFEPSSEEAEECLVIFRTRMLKNFPFVHLPSDMWAGRLRQTRPFLLTCIIAAVSKSTAKKLALGREIKQTLARRMLIEDGSSIDIDLLLGLLTFMAW